MALYRFESRILSRNHGHSSVSYAAYLSAEKLYDERYNEERLFNKKKHRERLYHSEILVPENAPNWTRNREELWNRNEAAEKRKDSQVARELIISLPRELTHKQNVSLGLAFIQKEYVAKGMVADVNFHNFTGKDAVNPHLQVLLTTRRIEGDRFAAKKEEAWRPPIVKDPKTGKAIVDPEFIKAERKMWEQHCNRALERAGLDQRVDCRSLKDQGVNRLPQPKKGKAHYMEVREEWQGQTRAGDAWREAQDLNTLKERLEELKIQGAIVEEELTFEQTCFAYELGRELAHEEQAKRKREKDITPQKSVSKKKQTGQGLEPWRRDWERQHDAQRKQRKQQGQERERKEQIGKKATKQPQVQKEQVTTPSLPDDRELIQAWHEYTSRERDEPRSHGESQGDKPERGVTQEQQISKLKEEMAAFDASPSKPEPGQEQKPKRTR